MSIVVLFAGILALSIGIALLWSHFGRFTTQVFAAMTLIVALHLFLIYWALQTGTIFEQDHSENPLPMLRAAAAVSMFIPWLLWIIKESLVTCETEKYRTLQRSLPWLGICVVLAAFCCTNSYYHYVVENLPAYRKHDSYYAPVNFTLMVIYTLLVAQSWLQMRLQTGIRRIEMQFLVLNSGVVALLAVGLALITHYLAIPRIRLLIHLVVIAGCALSAWAVTYYRVFDVRQVFISLAQRVGLVLSLGLCIFVGSLTISTIVVQPVALILSIVIFSSVVFWLDRRSRAWLGIDGEKALSEMRRAAIDIARAEPQAEKLENMFEAFLAEKCNAPFATMLFDQGAAYAGGGLRFPKTRTGCAALCETGWATPESLTRRRATSGLADLRSFLIEHSLGVMIAAPRGSQSPSLLLALGVKANEWPFTYPEVQRLQNIAELMDNILTRSRLTMQAAERAKIEHLAMMSRGLAHDLNNLITPISSFLVHTDEKFAPGSPEREVHGSAQRSVRVMTEYVREALFFSNRFTARFESVDLGRILQEVRALTMTRANERGVKVTETTESYGKFTADAVLLQRMLVNVVSNAIDASTPGQVVALSALPGRSGWLDVRVSDEGCGISPEDLEHIFDAYFTTKRYGDEVRGFGLGLTICQKIARLHGGTISVTSQLGRGTTVAIELPVEQGS